MSFKKLFFISLGLFFSFSLFSQEIPRGYKGIQLSIPLEAAKQALIDRPEFGYHGDSDVSLLPGENRILIETDAETGHGSSFLKRCYFQFYNNSLYIITINVNPEKMDYHSIFTTMCEKYGDPVSLDPQKAKWQSTYTTVYLEKPLTLKYIDNKTFERSQSSSLIGPAPEEMTRESFLDGL